MYSDARGSVQITSPTRAHPALRFNYLSTDQDRREWVEAIRCARAILGAAALRAVRRGRALARAGGRDDEEILDWVARDAETALHPSCTCRMGVDELSVVDPRRCACTGSTGCGSSTRR
jgi:choline dehydrogenase